MIKLSDFNGFNKDGLKFLDGLAKNNNKEWFELNKSTFKNILEPNTKNFTDLLAKSLEQLLRKPVKSKIFRIYRDVRFSKDKTPYNPHIRIAFYLLDNTTGPAFMISIEPTQSLVIGCGVFEFSKKDLNLYRESITKQIELNALDKILNDFRNNQFRIDIPSYKKIPRDYIDKYPDIELLKGKGLSAWNEMTFPKELLNDNAISFCTTQCKQMLPLFNWLNFK